MKVIKTEYLVFCDIDDTLVMHQDVGTYPLLEEIDIKDPIKNRIITLRMNKPMIRLVEEEKSKGAFIVAWSRGGHAWAEAVIRALRLEDSIDQIMSKPLIYFDDKPVNEWLQYRVYLGPETVYKK